MEYKSQMLKGLTFHFEKFLKNLKKKKIGLKHFLKLLIIIFIFINQSKKEIMENITDENLNLSKCETELLEYEILNVTEMYCKRNGM